MNRVELINEFIKERKFQSYLELGVYDSSTFNKILIDHKVSVDIKFPATFTMSTDQFFQLNSEKFDLIFIDADHRDFQLSKDIQNSLKILNKGGVVLCHDCNPPTEKDQLDENFLYQSAWKAWVRYRSVSEYLTYCIEDDCGIGVIDTLYPKNENIVISKELVFGDLQKNRNYLLGIKKYE